MLTTSRMRAAARGPFRSAAVIAAAALAACAGTQIGSPSDYEPVDLPRVFPYPSDDELARQKTEIVLASRYTRDLPKKAAERAMYTVQQSLAEFLTEAGAGVIDRSTQSLREVRRELSAARRREEGSGAEWALVSHVSRFAHRSEYAPPTGLFKSAEELQDEPGKCTHYGEIEVDVKAFKVPLSDVASATYKIRDSREFSEKDHDKRCPLDDSRRHAFLAEILEDALPCAKLSIQNRFAPRGYIAEHRASAAGDAHIFRTSLGRQNGARPGLELVIFRTQYMTTVDGRQARDERRIGDALVTDEIGDDYSWITVDVGTLEQPILAGDLVRAVYSDTLTGGLGFGRCRDILAVLDQG